MTHYVEFNGKKIPFPDGMKDEQISEILSALPNNSGNTNSSSMQNMPRQHSDALRNAVNPEGGTPFGMVRDVAGGLANFGQNAAALLGEGGQALASLATGGRAPQVNIREELGLEGPNKIDIGRMIASKNPNPLLMGGGELALPAIAGGASIPGQMASMGLYGAANAPTGKRISTGFKDALLAAIIPGGLKYGEKVKNYFHPEKEAKQFMQDLHGGTSQENTETLAKRLEFANKSGKQEALIPKEQLMAEKAGERIIPKVQVEQPNVEKISSIFSDEVSDAQAKKMTKAVKDYYDHGDVNKLAEEGEKIFGHEGLSEKELNKLESLLPFEKKKIPTGSYLKMENLNKTYSSNGELRQLHEAFTKNPSLENADKLKSAISREKRFYEKQQESNTIRDPGRRKLEQLKKAENSIQSDIDKFSETLSPHQKQLYNDFREKYAINAGKYNNKANPAIREAASGNIGNINEGSLHGEFQGPLGKNVLDILQDIGPSGEGNILYNKLADLEPGNIEALMERMTQLKQTGGMQRYIKPEHEELLKQLEKRLHHRRYLTAGSLLGAGGAAAALDHPYAGSALGVTGLAAAKGKHSLSKMILKLLK